MKKLALAVFAVFVFTSQLQANGQADEKNQSALSTAASGVSAYHKLKPHETIWFVAQIYYDSGYDYKKILEANHILRPEDVVVDQELVIPNPKWLETMPEFQAHFRLSLIHI